MFVHFCCSVWWLESSKSRWFNSEGSLHVPLSPLAQLPHVQLVEEHSLQLSRDQTPAIIYKPPAPRSTTGEKTPLRMRGAWRDGGGQGGAAALGAGPEGGETASRPLVRMLAVGLSYTVVAPASGVKSFKN